ncbi:hypothetical protein [Thermoanaerobacterium xylanolyticum]|uniref:hypothetical protein n=1 Tax=Thermoanaerobacterium xylanolyticum TaxID=29329 RepID=UPI0005A1681B|nr:hypothetical protein [Thermoanaerobacterium xylanolyticum]
MSPEIQMFQATEVAENILYFKGGRASLLTILIIVILSVVVDLPELFQADIFRYRIDHIFILYHIGAGHFGIYPYGLHHHEIFF